MQGFGLTCRLPMGEDAETLDALIEAVQTALEKTKEYFEGK